MRLPDGRTNNDCTIERFPKIEDTSLNLIDRAIAAIMKSFSSLDFGFWNLKFFWSLFFGIWILRIWIFHAVARLPSPEALVSDSIRLPYH